ncbi:hypothetical protein H8S23_06125 [Anaerofilum sp. BX8]|uniref:Uncharacterized protein n=1 Tax=Anaerofilum hominis TaxID=2763016 RepID=A0A923L0X8_9FIRM|nr:hypothetical protein [Anaerofilum hominis]MBC5581077.1 hypothetical protein [Anaerofilum hominis]
MKSPAGAKGRFCGPAPLPLEDDFQTRRFGPYRDTIRAYQGKIVLKRPGSQQQSAVSISALLAKHRRCLPMDPTGDLNKDAAADTTSILKGSTCPSGKCVVITAHSNGPEKTDMIFRLKKANCKSRILLTDGERH